MRRPLRMNQSRAQTAISRAVPFPSDGLDTESVLQSMKPTSAVILDNMIPRGGYGELRRGYVEQVSGIGAAVETLVVYKGAAAGDKLFACAGSAIYDVTSAGALGSAAYSSAASARWSSENFANDAGRWMILLNGAQNVVKYDGASFSNTTFTYGGTVSFDQTKLNYAFAHKGRLHLIEADSLHVWFAGIGAISGAVGLLDLGLIFTQGGSLVGGARLTIDGGNGPDDYAVYITSKGEVALYQGIDPSDASNWSLVGVFNLPKPLGDRCIVTNGADIAIMTEVGLIPLSVSLRQPEDDMGAISLSRRISSAVSDAASAYGANFGWQVFTYAGRGGLTIVNVPTAELSTAVQFVRSNLTGAWCRFTGLPAYCWAVANGNPYFGSADGVYRWDSGASDNSTPIVADILPAFSDFGDRTRTKNFTMVRALLRAPAIVAPALDVVTDFDKSTVPTDVQTVVTPADISPEDSDLIRDDWTAAAGLGYFGSPRMRISLTGANGVDRVAVTEDHADLLLVGPGGSDHILTRPNLPLDVTVQCVGFDVMFKVGTVLG